LNKKERPVGAFFHAKPTEPYGSRAFGTLEGDSDWLDFSVPELQSRGESAGVMPQPQEGSAAALNAERLFALSVQVVHIINSHALLLTLCLSIKQ